MFVIKNRISSVLLWSVISAAFIGPGTLAAASSAGALYKYSLIWALLFATLACIVLQEMAARISMATGKNLSLILTQHLGRLPSVFIGLAVVIGCAAYEAGNILGALSGVTLIFSINRYLVLSIIGIAALLLLGFGTRKIVINSLGALVALMGLLFVFMAFQSPASIGQLFEGTVPNFPRGSQWVTLALIGTTIVPYNIYLGSGLSEGQSLKEMRFGLTISVALGGIISIAILITATQIDSMNSFLDLAYLLKDTFGYWAYLLMGIGLFAAGFTSSVTAPLAAGLITEGLFKDEYATTRKWYRLGWLIVLLVGLLFGLLDVKPIPIIVAAQALNGFILPLLGFTLILAANDISQMKNEINSTRLNIIAFLLLEILLLLGFNGVWKAVDGFIYTLPESGTIKYIVIQSCSLIIFVYALFKVYNQRKG